MRFFHLRALNDSPRAVEFRDSETRLTFAEGQLTGIESRPAQTSVTIEKGTKWKDVIGGLNCATFFLLLSEKTVRAFETAGLAGYEVEPLRIDEIRSKTLRNSTTTQPWYSLLKVVGKADLDFESSGIPADEAEAAATMPATPARPRASRYVFDENSWDGCDFFTIGNYRTGHMFCSEKVVSVAREHHLTNFEFMPSTLLPHQKLTWRGVDYLGRKWPPSWEPPHAREQRSLEAWLAALRAETGEGGWEVHNELYTPLMDFGLEAVPGLLEILRTGNLAARRKAARALYNIRVNNHLRLPKQAIGLAEEFMPEELLPAFRKAR